MKLQLRMWVLVALLFALMYGVIAGIGTYLGIGGFAGYIVLSLVLVGVQYLTGPWLVSALMRVKYVSEQEEPELHQMIGELAARAGIPKPGVGISQISIPNAFAFGRSQSDGRVCVTQGLRDLLRMDELKAVVGHEISHLKHRDMLVITLLSVIPLVFYWLAQNFIWGRAGGDRRRNGTLIGIGAMMVYYFSNLLVLYGSRIREYYADEGSVSLGNSPGQLASALYKLVFASSRLGATAGGREEVRHLSGMKAFFLNDISRSWKEVRELRDLDTASNGTLNQSEFLSLKFKEVKLGTAEKVFELLTTHPNVMKRLKHLAMLA